MFHKQLDQGEAGDNAGFYFEVLKKMMLKEVKFWQNQAQLLLILSLKLKFTFFPKKRVDDIHHF
jgi:hypothetical protein